MTGHSAEAAGLAGHDGTSAVTATELCRHAAFHRPGTTPRRAR